MENVNTAQERVTWSKHLTERGRPRTSGSDRLVRETSTEAQSRDVTRMRGGEIGITHNG